MSTLAFVQVAVPALVMLVEALAWLLFGHLIVFPWIEEQMGGKQPWWKRAALKPVSFLQNRAKRLVARLKADAATRFALASPQIARWLHRNAAILEQLSGVIVASNEATYKALSTLRHTTVPTLIANATRPILFRLGQVEALAAGLATTLTSVSTSFANGLRALPWGVPTGLPNRVDTFFVTYKRIWDKVWLELAPRTTELWTQIVPQLRQRIEDLERGVGGVGQGGLNAIRNRVTALENQAGNIILPRLSNLEAAVQALSAEVFGTVGTGLLALVGRVTELERRLDELVTTGLAELEQRIATIEAELEQGIAEGLERFGEHILEIERQITTVLPQRIAALELAVDTLVATALEGLEVGLIDLTGRIVALEAQIRDVILPGFDAILGRVSALEERIENVILPRIRAIETILAPAAFAALVLATMRQVAPNLFCRNTTSVTERICGLDEDMLAQLLAGTLGFALILNPELVARTGQEVEQTIEYAYRTMAGL